MPPKRPISDSDSRPAKKAKKGFSVGPANLPDGTYKRKVQKIKKDLIHKAKLKKQYAKVRERELQNQPQRPALQNDSEEIPNEASTPAPESTLEPHPDRQALRDQPSPEPQPRLPQKHQRRPKPSPFAREAALAQKRKEEAEARRLAFEKAEKERQEKLAERERFRKAMAKARGPHGQRKLGRESGVLLEKVRRMVGGS